MDDPSAVGESGSFKCGDTMKLYIKVKDGIIEDVKFQTFGCGAAIASSSMLTELVKGKTLDEALKVTNEDVAEELGGLPPLKMHCSNPVSYTHLFSGSGIPFRPEFPSSGLPKWPGCLF